jgi:hypothetical protein
MAFQLGIAEAEIIGQLRVFIRVEVLGINTEQFLEGQVPAF